MLLAPRQLRRSGMTGNVPYYGGRFTPAQAYAASHPTWRPPASAPRAGVATSRGAMPEPSRPTADTLAALQHLQETGVITAQEYDELSARVTP